MSYLSRYQTVRAVAYVREPAADPPLRFGATYTHPLSKTRAGRKLESFTRQQRVYGDSALEIIDWWSDDPDDDRRFDVRPGLERALAAVRSGTTNALLVQRLEDLTRSVLELSTLWRNYFSTGANDLIAIEDKIDTRGAGEKGRQMDKLLDVVAGWSSTPTGVSSRRDSAGRSRTNRCRGDTPIGYRCGWSGILLQDQQEQRAIDEICKLRDAGLGARRIAAALNHRGIPARGARWHATTIGRVLERLDR